MRYRTVVTMLVCLLPLATARGADDAGGDLLQGIEPIVHLRTYYFDGTNTSDAQSEAWALGGWAGFTTRWYGDLFKAGVLGYTSQRLYGPADKGGTLLLATGQDPITIVGQAYGSLRLAGQTFTGYRQMVDQPWVNPQDNRMIPNLFEGYLLSGKVADVDYIGGYVTKVKTRGADSFQWMSSAAGSTGPLQGMVLFGARLPLGNVASLRIAEQYVIDTFNTAYVDGEYPVLIGTEAKLRLGGQYANQQSVGAAGLGTFNTSMVGLRGVYGTNVYGLQLAWTQTSRNRATMNPYGDNPSFLNMMQVNFNNAGEKAWLIGGNVDFGPLGVPGFKALANYGSGRGSINPSTGAPLGSRNETDVKLAYVFDAATKLGGLSFGVQGTWLNQAGALAQSRQLRVFANYDVPLKPL